MEMKAAVAVTVMKPVKIQAGHQSPSALLRVNLYGRSETPLREYGCTPCDQVFAILLLHILGHRSRLATNRMDKAKQPYPGSNTYSLFGFRG